MRARHNICVAFGDPNLVSVAVVLPVMALAETAGLPELVTEQVHVPDSAGDADLKVASLIAGMVACADTTRTWTASATVAWDGSPLAPGPLPGRSHPPAPRRPRPRHR